jgi:hypothetical protein
MLAELNKIAIIHLFLLGFEDELGNFTLGLTNPSTQADLLKIDVWKEKILLYKDLVADPGNGIQATSSTWAKKHIIERAVGEELKATPTVISKTGVFDNIDKLYGSQTGGTATATAGAETSPEVGGAPLGGEAPLTPPPPEPEAGGTPPPPEPEAGGAVTPESVKKDMNILLEGNFIRGSAIIDLGQAQDSLGKISEELDKLLES